MNKNPSISLPTNAILMVVAKRSGHLESVAVYSFSCSDKPFKSFVGNCDIVYSYGPSYKRLHRPKSGFFTGKPLKSETITVTSLHEAHEKAEILCKIGRARQY